MLHNTFAKGTPEGSLITVSRTRLFVFHDDRMTQLLSSRGLALQCIKGVTKYHAHYSGSAAVHFEAVIEL